MKGRSNCSAGFSDRDAILDVYAPAGSTVSFSKGGILVKTLNASRGLVDSGNTGMAHYYYPVAPSSFGEWTVSIVTGDSKTKSLQKTVSENKLYEIVILPDLVFTPNGEALAWTRYNGSKSKNNSLSASVSDDKIVISGSGTTSTTGQTPVNHIYSDLFDLTYYNRFVLHGTSSVSRSGSSSDYETRFGLTKTKFHDAYEIQIAGCYVNNRNQNNTNWNLDADITNLTGTYCFFACITLWHTSYNASCSNTLTELRFSID